MDALDLTRRTLATMDDHDDTAKDLAFAILAADENDAATLTWLAACAIRRADEV